ncbi:MAG: AbrB/MazE/SpoVT family DNA-binding domain-containing protein [Sphingomonas sp.]
MPWLRPTEKKDYRVKVFRSGNSLALRLPAELGLQAGTEMRLRVENGEIVSLEPIDRPKRKFNVAKVCGSATTLRPIRDEDRIFEDRPLAWPSGKGEDPA